MNPRLQWRIQRYGWDKAGTSYEQYWQEQLWPAQERLLAKADLQPGERVLDLACGTGLVSMPAARAVAPTGSVLGLDISERMVELASEQAAAQGIEAGLRFERAEAERSGQADRSFEVALCALGLMYVPEPEVTLAEMHRVLVDDGRAAILVWGDRRACGWAEIFGIVDARVQSQVCPMFFEQGTGETLRLGLEQAGFRDIETERLSTQLLYPSAEAALGAAFAGGLVALAYSRFDEATRESAHAEYVASIEEFREGQGYSIPGEFVVATARK